MLSLECFEGFYHLCAERIRKVNMILCSVYDRGYDLRVCPIECTTKQSTVISEFFALLYERIGSDLSLTVSSFHAFVGSSPRTAGAIFRDFFSTTFLASNCSFAAYSRSITALSRYNSRI